LTSDLHHPSPVTRHPSSASYPRPDLGPLSHVEPERLTWLSPDRLAAGPRRGTEVQAEAEAAGISLAILRRAREVERITLHKTRGRETSRAPSPQANSLLTSAAFAVTLVPVARPGCGSGWWCGIREVWSPLLPPDLAGA
jgi:hypothetical protein